MIGSIEFNSEESTACQFQPSSDLGRTGFGRAFYYPDISGMESR